MNTVPGIQVWEKAFYQCNPYTFQQMKSRGFGDFIKRMVNYISTNESQTPFKGDYYLRGEDCLLFYHSYLKGKLELNRKPILYRRVESRSGMKSFLNFSSFLGKESMILGFGRGRETSFCYIVPFYCTEERPEMLLAGMGENNALQMALHINEALHFKTIMCEEYLVNQDIECYPFLGIKRSLEKSIELKNFGLGKFDPQVEVPALVCSKRVRDNSFQSDFTFKEQTFFIDKIREFFKDDLEKEELLTFFFRACFKLDKVDLISLKELLNYPMLSDVFRKVCKFSLRKLREFLKFFRTNMVKLKLMFEEYQNRFPNERFNLDRLKRIIEIEQVHKECTITVKSVPNNSDYGAIRFVA